MLEEYTIPAMLVVFLTGFLIGLNLGMICNRGSSDTYQDIPAYAIRREQPVLRYPSSNVQQRSIPQSWSGMVEPSGKKRMMMGSNISFR